MLLGLKWRVVITVGLGCLFNLTCAVYASDLSMKGPIGSKPGRPVQQTVETSCLKIAFAGAIRFYQKRISPVGGVDRCGFRPSCSAYGYEAVATQGPVIGLLMIGDRLTRCNIFKAPGPDYTLLPNGKLYDPPSRNLLY